MQPWHLLLSGVIGWTNRAQQQVIEDVSEQNRMPRKQTGQKRLGLAVFSAIIALGFAGLPASAAAKSALSPVDLRCEYLKNPLGIDVSQPELSWRLESATSSSRGQSQTAYQVLVATSETALRHDQCDLWDSGKVLSDQSLHVAYAGKPLVSQQGCWWKVRIWDEAGQPSPWSQPARWSMGLLKPEDWKAKWIGLDGGEETKPVDTDEHRRLPARMLRREFLLAKPITRATAYICGLGFFECSLNGRKVGDHVMDPALTCYDKRAMYVTFDVTENLRHGTNAVGVWLGNGRFFAPRIRVPTLTKTFGYPKLLFQLHVEYADGSAEDLTSDEQWKITTAGPIRVE